MSFRSDGTCCGDSFISVFADWNCKLHLIFLSWFGDFFNDVIFFLNSVPCRGKAVIGIDRLKLMQCVMMRLGAELYSRMSLPLSFFFFLLGLYWSLYVLFFSSVACCLVSPTLYFVSSPLHSEQLFLNQDQQALPSTSVRQTLNYWPVYVVALFVFNVRVTDVYVCVCVCACVHVRVLAVNTV